MTDANGDGESTDGSVDRRTVLKGTAATGLAGSALVGPASARTGRGSGRTDKGSGRTDREITFCAAGSETFHYFVRVSGSLERGGRYQSDEGDAVGDVFAEGAVSEERCDSFEFTGEVEALELSGDGKVFVDGDLFKDTTDEDHEDDEDEKLPNRITLEADDGRVEYKFRVSGRVEKGEDAGTFGADTIDGNVVRGAVGGSIQGNDDSADDYWYSGALAFDAADGPLTVTLDLAGD